MNATVNETELREAIKLLEKINDDPAHPANDARHLDHQACLKVCEELEEWVSEQQELLSKLRLNDGCLYLDH